MSRTRCSCRPSELRSLLRACQIAKMHPMPLCLTAGAAIADITPRDSQFPFGYPHVLRCSTGVYHPPAEFRIVFVRRIGLTPVDGQRRPIFISRGIASRVRRRIERQTGISTANMLISATHTHSGPITASMLSNELDPSSPQQIRSTLHTWKMALSARQSRRLTLRDRGEMAWPSRWLVCRDESTRSRGTLGSGGSRARGPRPR